MNNSDYIGQELDVFKEAVNWKTYWLKHVKSYINGKVLEVGAGLGVNTKMIIEECSDINSLTAIEPDNKLASQILDYVGPVHNNLTIKNCYTSDLDPAEKFDTIMYIDVIEHIEDDKGEIARAEALLKDNGHLIVLVPAHNYVFSPFDKAIGHFRRYDKKMLRKVASGNMNLRRIFYLDSLGLLASLVNKYFLKQSYPTKQQVLKWDRLIVPLSKVSDKIILHSNGKSLIGIWQKSSN